MARASAAVSSVGRVVKGVFLYLGDGAPKVALRQAVGRRFHAGHPLRRAIAANSAGVTLALAKAIA